MRRPQEPETGSNWTFRTLVRAVLEEGTAEAIRKETNLMGDQMTDIAGIEVPFYDPIFLAVVGVHILLGLACTVAGVVAMLSRKREGRHPRFGAIYFWCLTGVFLTSTILAAARWVEDYHLFILGALSFAAAYAVCGIRGPTEAQKPLTLLVLTMWP